MQFFLANYQCHDSLAKRSSTRYPKHIIIKECLYHGKGIMYSLKDDDETIHSDWSDLNETPSSLSFEKLFSCPDAPALPDACICSWASSWNGF